MRTVRPVASTTRSARSVTSLRAPRPEPPPVAWHSRRTPMTRSRPPDAIQASGLAFADDLDVGQRLDLGAYLPLQVAGSAAQHRLAWAPPGRTSDGRRTIPAPVRSRSPPAFLHCRDRQPARGTAPQGSQRWQQRVIVPFPGHTRTVMAAWRQPVPVGDVTFSYASASTRAASRPPMLAPTTAAWVPIFPSHTLHRDVGTPAERDPVFGGAARRIYQRHRVMLYPSSRMPWRRGH